MKLIKNLFACLLISASSLLVNAQSMNQLTAAEKQQGWKLLFDGKTLNGWRNYNNATSDAWYVSEGLIKNKKEDVTGRADLITREKFDNFELVFDWKVDKGANSGVIYLIEEGKHASYESGPEYQLIDDHGYEHELSDGQKSGANYDMYPPTSVTSKPVGEFNTSRIIVKDGHIEHWLNGVKVVEYENNSDDWKQRKEKSKWKDVMPYGQAKSGHIALQDHGGGIYFRNIKVRKL